MSSTWVSVTSSSLRLTLQGLLAVVILLGCPTPGEAKVFYSRSEALELAFPGYGAFSGTLEHWHHDVFRLYFDGGDGGADLYRPLSQALERERPDAKIYSTT